MNELEHYEAKYLNNELSSDSDRNVHLVINAQKNGKGVLSIVPDSAISE